MIKRVDGVRKQFLILNSEPILAFVKRGKKFTACTSYTEVTANVDCKVKVMINKHFKIDYIFYRL